MSGAEAGPRGGSMASSPPAGGGSGGLWSRLLGRRARKAGAEGRGGLSGGQGGLSPNGGGKGDAVPRRRRKMPGETWRVKVSYDTGAAGPPDVKYRVERGPVKGGLVLSVEGNARQWRDSEVRLECVAGHAAALPRAEELQLNVDAKMSSLLKRVRYEQELVRVARGEGLDGWRLKSRNVVRTTTALEGLGDLALDYTLPEEGLRVLPVAALAAAEDALPSMAVRAFREHLAALRKKAPSEDGTPGAQGAATNGVGGHEEGKAAAGARDLGRLCGSLTAPVLDETLATVQVGYDFQTRTVTDVEARKDLGVLGKGSVAWDMSKPADERLTLRTMLVPQPNQGLRSCLRLGASWVQDTDMATLDAKLEGFLRADRTLLYKLGRVDVKLQAATLKGPLRETWRRYRDEWALVGIDAKAAWLRGDLTPRLVISKTLKL